VGKGSRFWFDVPVVLGAGVAPAALASTEGAPITGYGGPRRRVLVVDDVPVNREVVKEMLAPLGFDVDSAADGASAIERIGVARPDLVLMDLRMTPMRGEEAVARLRADVSTRDLKIVAFSASTIGFTRTDALRLGCDDYLSKPFREEELFVILERQLALEWVRAADVVAPAGELSGERPSHAQVAELLASARQGDAAALRVSLKTMVAANPGLGAFATGIEELAVRFQMQEIRHRLERLMNDAN
jgi:CheY-like chemotaxis protein